MFKHILIPTDGSALAGKAIKAGIEFARDSGAKITLYQALDNITPIYQSEGYALPTSVLDNMEKIVRAHALRNLDEARDAATKAGVTCDTVLAKAFRPDEGIIATAKKRKCDVIFMASHGRRGLEGLLMGSVTNRVLTHSRLPVVVYR